MGVYGFLYRRFGEKVMNAFLSFLEVRITLSWTEVAKKKEVKATAEEEGGNGCGV